MNVADRKAFLLRVDPALLERLQRWANDDLRSLNGQIEFVLRRSLREAGRVRPSEGDNPPRPPAPDTGGTRKGDTEK
jgi:hypothetical protein